jgi:hypothetical protein
VVGVIDGNVDALIHGMLRIGSHTLVAGCCLCPVLVAPLAVRHRTQPMRASSMARMTSAVLTIGPMAEGTVSGST